MSVLEAVKMAEWLFKFYFDNYFACDQNKVVLDAVIHLNKEFTEAKVVIEE